MLIEWITYHNLMLCVMSICEQNAVIFRFGSGLPPLYYGICADCIGMASAEICRVFGDGCLNSADYFRSS